MPMSVWVACFIQLSNTLDLISVVTLR